MKKNGSKKIWRNNDNNSGFNAKTGVNFFSKIGDVQGKGLYLQIILICVLNYGYTLIFNSDQDVGLTVFPF